MRPLRLVALLLAAGPLAGCGDRAAPPPAVSLSVAADPRTGVLHRLVGSADPGGETMSLAHQRSADGGLQWSAPVRVEADPGGPPIKKVSRGEDAAIAVGPDGRTLLAVWPGRGTGVWGSGPLGSALSRDGGATWTPAGDPAPFPADDPVAEHGARFPALLASPGPGGSGSGSGGGGGGGGGGGFTLAWIDASDEARGVRANRFDPAASSWGEPVTVDPTSCACCWNALAAVGEEAVFVYRDADPSDMSAARSPDGGASWSDPAPVGGFGWVFDGCPHVGAGLAAEPDGGRLFAAVWTGKEGEAGLYACFSDDAGATWSQPARLGGRGDTHPRLAALGGGRVAAAWTRHTREGTTLVYAVSEDRGASWPEPEAFAGGGGTLPSHALLTAAGGGLTAHWTQSTGDGPAEVRSRVLRSTAGPRPAAP